MRVREILDTSILFSFISSCIRIKLLTTIIDKESVIQFLKQYPLIL